MTIHERMVARSDREKDLLKYGRSQERERIIKLLEKHITYYDDSGFDFCDLCGMLTVATQNHLIELIKEKNNE